MGPQSHPKEFKETPEENRKKSGSINAEPVGQKVIQKQNSKSTYPLPECIMAETPEKLISCNNVRFSKNKTNIRKQEVI